MQGAHAALEADFAAAFAELAPAAAAVHETR